MRPILSVATTAFRESIRNRTLLAILVLAVGFIVSALLLAELALDQRTRVILDWGLFCVSLFGVFLAILMGVSQVHKEVRRKNLYVILTRPIHRWQYVLGKYMGLGLTLLVEVGALSAALVLLLAFEGISPGVLLFKALFLAVVEILLVAALAVFFASFSTPYLSGMFTFGLFVAGRSLPTLEALAQRTDNPVAYGVLKGLVYGLPDLANFNLSTRVVHKLSIGWSEVGWLTAYGVGYIALLLILSAWIFSRRDLT
jgi:ABC-type transport system involved in multi-copper enzyme maturation permease subunit